MFKGKKTTGNETDIPDNANGLKHIDSDIDVSSNRPIDNLIDNIVDNSTDPTIANINTTVEDSLTSDMKKMKMTEYNIKNMKDLLREAKWVNIPIFGSVKLTIMALLFANNKFFQRLDGLKQLGVSHKIFPGGVHTRKEHSFATYFVTDKLLTRLRAASDNDRMHEWLLNISELKIHYAFHINTCGKGLNPWIIELVKIAALLHDVGHGPYSHLFDDIFIKNSQYRDHIFATHESRSCAIVNQIVKETPMLDKYLSESDIRFIQNLIDPPNGSKGFITQIVSNPFNDLDCDKEAYISSDAYHTGARNPIDIMKIIENAIVIDDIITYPEQVAQHIFELFATRHAMHRSVYCHKSVISIQYVIIGIMKIIDKVIDLSGSIMDLNNFIKMTDSHIIEFGRQLIDMRYWPVNPFADKMSDEDYEALIELYYRYDNHVLYPHIGTIITKKPFDISKHFDSDTYLVFKGKLGYVSGNKSNPLEQIYVYKSKDYLHNGNNLLAKKINKNQITHLMPNIHQEYITMVFRRDNDERGKIDDVYKFKLMNDEYMFNEQNKQ